MHAWLTQMANHPIPIISKPLHQLVTIRFEKPVFPIWISQNGVKMTGNITRNAREVVGRYTNIILSSPDITRM